MNENIPPTQSPGARGTVDIVPQKPGSPPIRVPTYHRPSILQVSLKIFLVVLYMTGTVQ